MGLEGRRYPLPMAATRRERQPAPPPRRRSGSAASGYAQRSKRPFHVLIFLLPLIVFYEVGASFYLTEAVSGQVETIRAYRIISDVFRFLGAVGSPVMERIPSALIVVVLLAWHVLNRDPLRVRPRTLGGMALESFAWALPLVMLLQLVAGITGGLAAPAAAPGGNLASLPPMSLAVISVGAGLYEELLFRLLAITLIHLFVVDFLGMREKRGTALAVALAAVAFALYHDRSDLSAVVTYLLAGVYFGLVFVWRGLGIAVATHALYNLAVTVLIPALASNGSS